MPSSYRLRFMTSFLATNCPDPQLCLELLRSDYVSLNGMFNRALTYEQALLVIKKPTEEVNAVQAKKHSRYQQGKRNKNQPSATKGKGQPTKKKCTACDSEKHEQNGCPHREKICSFCKIKGHIEMACRKKKQKEEGRVPKRSGRVLFQYSFPNATIILMTIHAVRSATSKLITGASKTLINEAFAKIGSLSISSIETYCPQTSWWHNFASLGSTMFSATLQEVTATIKAIVVNDLHKNLSISWQDLIQLRVINPNFPT